MKSNSKSRNKLIIIFLLVVVLLCASGILVYLKNQDSQTVGDTDSKTTSSVKSAQSNFSDGGSDKQLGSTSNKEDVSGGITDSQGTAPTNTSNPTSSENGAVVVYSPAKNSLISNGATISGSSSLSKVSYRIVDTDVGMISTGSLNVINGKFSGTIQFQTKAQNGQLDFFGTQADGNEFDNVSIPVRFK